MNIYKSLNEVVNYIEENLEQKIDTQILAKMVGVSSHTLQNIFPLITNVGLTEYIRNRRLSRAVVDLQSGLSVMDVAMKYQYNSAVAFSRAFTKFHGVKPSEVKKENVQTVSYPILNFDEDNKAIIDMSYKIEKRGAFKIYGVKIKTDEDNISYDAPRFFSATKRKYQEYGDIHYGMVRYEKRFQSKKMEYWCLFDKMHDGLEEISFPVSKWLIFKVNSRQSRDIQNLSHKFYFSFLAKNKYHLKDLPELEVYQDEFTEFMIAIE